MKKEMKKGFTLIELLIVVAIIAILAAIAVPNFLEAQTRSKISRAKADMRSLATAVESYAVDYNTPPPGEESFTSYVGWTSTEGNARGQALLTTPIAYITAILHDPFKTTGTVRAGVGTSKPDARFFDYDDFRIPSDHGKGAYRVCYLMGYTWSLCSVGPLRNNQGQNTKILRGTINTANPYQTTVVYDPSNGTMSVGWIVRTNKGICTGPGN